MDIINQLNSCAQVGGNTGIGPCFNNPTFIKGFIFVPAGKQYDATTLTALKTALEADLLADIPSERAYPIGGFVAPTDNTQKAIEQTFADGSIQIVRSAVYDWSFQFIKGGLCLSVAMQKANGLNRWFFAYDDQGRFYGVKGTSAGMIQGVNPNLAYTPPFTLNTGAAVTVYETRVNFTSDQLNVNAAIIDFSGDGGGLSYLQGLSGLQDVTVYSAGARSAGVAKIGAKTACGTVDLHATFASELAVVGAWRVRNLLTKKPLTVTAVADDPTDLGWSITVSSSDANYAAPGGLEYALAGPTELDGLDVTGYESNWVTQ